MKRRTTITPVIALSVTFSCLFGHQGQAWATDYVFNLTVDLSSVPVQNVVDIDGHPGQGIKFDAHHAAADIFVTDTLTFNLDFLGGQHLHVMDTVAPFRSNNELFILSFLPPEPNSLFIIRGHDSERLVHFSGSGSFLVNPIHLVNESSFSGDLTDTGFLLQAISISMTFSNPVLDPAVPLIETLGGLRFGLQADALEVCEKTTADGPCVPITTTVPESGSTCALLIASLTGVGFLRRYQRRRE
jgi:hypothetical protein